MNSDLLLVLRARIDQHLKFFDTLERIRWQFTTAFAGGAGVAIFVAIGDQSSVQKQWVALVLVVGFSCAGLIAQVRIFGLIVVIWKRMLVLQSKEFELLKEYKNIEAGLQEALSFPSIGLFKSRILHFLTVGMASCLVFSIMIGTAIALALQATKFSSSLSITSGLIFAVLVAASSYFGTKLYVGAVESSDTILSFPKKPRERHLDLAD